MLTWKMYKNGSERAYLGRVLVGEILPYRVKAARCGLPAYTSCVILGGQYWANYKTLRGARRFIENSVRKWVEDAGLTVKVQVKP